MRVRLPIKPKPDNYTESCVVNVADIWKRPKTKLRNLMKMGVPKDLVWKAAMSRRGYWFTTHTVAVNMAMTKERLKRSGFYDLPAAYQSVRVNY